MKTAIVWKEFVPELLKRSISLCCISFMCKLLSIYLYIYRVFLKSLYKIVGGIVDMKINIIKWGNMVRKHLL